MIKPIETRYKGYRFRSRLEARWAVFFDCMGFAWEYEPEGFILDDGTHYLPDFRVKTPQGEDIWYEVKRAGILEDAKFNAFLRSQPDTDVFRAELLSGDPIHHFSRKIGYENGLVGRNKICPRCGLIADPAYGGFDDYFGCGPCDLETPCGGNNEKERGVLGVWVTPHKGHLIFRDELCRKKFASIIMWAAKTARSARFEHGERHA